MELLAVDEGAEVTFNPITRADCSSLPTPPSQLEGARVVARVVGTSAGPKIDGFTYKRRTNQRRRYGHRQHYSRIEITSISKG